MVVEGSYVLTLNGEEVRMGAGQEYFIPKGTRIAGPVTTGTRTIYSAAGALSAARAETAAPTAVGNDGEASARPAWTARETVEGRRGW